MANRDNPMGFRPVDRQPHTELTFDIKSSNATNVFIGDVMSIASTGGVTPAAADDAGSVVGVCVGLYDSNGRQVGHPNSSVSTKYLPSLTAGKALIALSLPGRRFIAQVQTGVTLATTDVFATTDHVAGTGDTTTAVSRHEIDGGSLNTAAQLLILGKVEEPNNAWGEHVDLYVNFNESIWNGIGKAVGV